MGLYQAMAPSGPRVTMSSPWFAMIDLCWTWVSYLVAAHLVRIGRIGQNDADDVGDDVAGNNVAYDDAANVNDAADGVLQGQKGGRAGAIPYDQH